MEVPHRPRCQWRSGSRSGDRLLRRSGVYVCWRRGEVVCWRYCTSIWYCKQVWRSTKELSAYISSKKEWISLSFYTYNWACFPGSKGLPIKTKHDRNAVYSRQSRPRMCGGC